MPYITDVVIRGVGGALNTIRDWLFSIPTDDPPTSQEVTDAVNAFVETMIAGREYQRFTEWVEAHPEGIVQEIIGVYRVR